jgi:ABC-2 type transport system permease protein
VSTRDVSGTGVSGSGVSGPGVSGSGVSGTGVSGGGAGSVAAPARREARADKRTRRPSTLTATRWELRKLISQKRTFLGFGIVMLLPLIFVVSQHLREHRHGGGEDIFAAQITQSGLATPVLMLLFQSFFLLPLVAALVAGDIVAAEDGNGTLKTILTRSVDRGQIFAAKVLAAIVYAIIAVYLSALTATVAGVASWGFHGIRTYTGTYVTAPKGLLLVFAANGAFLIPLLTVVCLGVLLSTITRNSAAAVVGTVAFTILLVLIKQIPGLEGLGPYLLTDQYQAWQGLLRTPTDWVPIWHSVWVCALYAAPALVGAYLVFLRRDVAGG